MHRDTLRTLSVLAALTLCCAPATASAQEGGGSEGGGAGGEIVPGAEGPLPNRGDIAVDELVVTGDIVLDDESEILIGRDPGTGLRLDTLEVDRLVVAGREVTSPRSDGTIRAAAGLARTATAAGPSSSTHACMLTRFDSGGIAQCRVYVSRGRWRLRAGNAECEARCIRLR